MKKFIFAITAVSGLLFAPTALAATNLILSPANISVKAGQIFSVVITVDPQGVKNSTIKTELDFPAGLLAFQSRPPAIRAASPRRPFSVRLLLPLKSPAAARFGPRPILWP